MTTKQRDIVVSTLMIPRPRESDGASFEAIKKRERKREREKLQSRVAFLSACVSAVFHINPAIS
jgi:hypothetical protein